MRKKAIQIVIIIIGISLIVNLTRDILRLLKTGGRIEQAENRLEETKGENKQLSEKKQYYASEEFIEETARDKLNMARSGETIVVLPPNLAEVVGRKEKGAQPELPNWQKWWDLFFPAIRSPKATPAG